MNYAAGCSAPVQQRIVTYALAMLAKESEMLALLVSGFLLTQYSPLTPLLILFLNDSLTMSVSTDRMTYSLRPNR